MAISNMMISGDPSIQQFASMVSDLETQELESPAGIATPEVYGQLLAIYLLQNDLPNAKFLWKRIPVAVKESNPELGKIWNVGQKLWLQSPEVYSALAEEWPEYVKPILAAIGDVTRNRAFRLVAKAYTSISVENVASFLGLSSEDCVEAVSAVGWEVDAACKIVNPNNNENRNEDTISSEEQLAKLTDFVAFLEN